MLDDLQDIIVAAGQTLLEVVLGKKRTPLMERIRRRRWRDSPEDDKNASTLSQQQDVSIAVRKDDL